MKVTSHTRPSRGQCNYAQNSRCPIFLPCRGGLVPIRATNERPSRGQPGPRRRRGHDVREPGRVARDQRAHLSITQSTRSAGRCQYLNAPPPHDGSEIRHLTMGMAPPKSHRPQQHGDPIVLKIRHRTGAGSSALTKTARTGARDGRPSGAEEVVQNWRRLCGMARTCRLRNRPALSVSIAQSTGILRGPSPDNSKKRGRAADCCAIWRGASGRRVD